MMEGDTIVLGSDGLFDNVYNRDIESIVKATEERSPESAQLIGNLSGGCIHAYPS